jgi:hypothetical protein
VKEIFLNFRGSASLVVVMVVGVSMPKTIPHFRCAPYGSEAYVNALFKACQYKNVHIICYLSELPSQSRYPFEPLMRGSARISGTS